MDAEERQPRVGHGVDEPADELAAVWSEPQIGAAERNDPRVGPCAGQRREPVRPRARAEHGEARDELAA